MFNSYFFSKFVVLVVGFSICPALLGVPNIISTAGQTTEAASKPRKTANAAQRAKSQMLRLRVARLTGERAVLVQQNMELRQLASQGEAEKKVAIIAIADLKAKLAKAEADAFAKYQGDVTAMAERLQTYISESDANLAAMKADLESLQTGFAQSQREARLAIARAIVKRRVDRAEERTIVTLRDELTKSQNALRLALATPAQPATVSPPAQEAAAVKEQEAPKTAAAAAPAVPLAAASEKQLTAEKPKAVKRKPVRQTESSGFSFFP